MPIMGIPAQIKTDNACTYVSNKMKQFFAYHNMNHIKCLPQNHTGQAVVEISSHVLKERLIKQRENKTKRLSQTVFYPVHRRPKKPTASSEIR